MKIHNAINLGSDPILYLNHVFVCMCVIRKASSIARTTYIYAATTH